MCLGLFVWAPETQQTHLMKEIQCWWIYISHAFNDVKVAATSQPDNGIMPNATK